MVTAIKTNPAKASFVFESFLVMTPTPGLSPFGEIVIVFPSLILTSTSPSYTPTIVCFLALL